MLKIIYSFPKWSRGIRTRGPAVKVQYFCKCLFVPPALLKAATAMKVKVPEGETERTIEGRSFPTEKVKQEDEEAGLGFPVSL